MFAAVLALALTLGQAVPVASPSVAEAFLHVGPSPPPHGYPAIRSVELSTTNVRVGRPVRGSVETSENVHYVEARVEYRNAALHEDAPGKFSLTYTVPWWLPWWLRHRGYSLQIIARSVDGVETTRTIPITVN